MHGVKYIPYFSLFAFCLAGPTIHESDEPPLDAGNKYIIILKPGVELGPHLTHVQRLHTKTPRSHEGDHDFEGVMYHYVIDDFNAYAGHFDKTVLEHLKADSDVLAIEKERSPIYLNLISHRDPGKDKADFVYDSHAGGGTYAYIVDTGINIKHQDFEGRATRGHTVFKGSTPNDRVGHGTHFAAIVGGKRYGVAKKCNLIAVKVFSGVYTCSSNIMAGLTWATKDIEQQSRKDKAVVTLALIPFSSWAINKALVKVKRLGITTVVAAGNSNIPSRWTVDTIAVGATDNARKRAVWSNYGPKITLWAPGSDVKSAWMGSNSATGKISGTSPAAAQTAGVLLTLMASESDPISGPKEGKDALVKLATPKVVGDAKNSPNLFLYNGSGE
ncbi:alkaline serine protease Alp1 [Myriangium duriaei CBS 260.36]|uniref:Alkaline serine protease Alp1 n=1 Tax=Myriangium duriaei CBS 260.36 TaxID=1168546 RepID=A0A9P4IVQ3_9PEZI|nr:alkaline serine protease Alp1 [Myriangium duriaei CBS 260.36]